jgi:hypothetical protein
MSARRSRSGVVLGVTLAGVGLLARPIHVVSAAPPDAGAGPALPGFADHAWPTQIGPEPEESDWATAVSLDPGGAQGQYAVLGPAAVCTHKAIGAWLRITCVTDQTLGALWGLAGDLTNVKASFVTLAERDHPAKPPSYIGERIKRKMGVSITITLPVTPGSATLLRLDKMDWDDGYNESMAFTSPGCNIDVAWALGEKAPTIFYR